MPLSNFSISIKSTIILLVISVYNLWVWLLNPQPTYTISCQFYHLVQSFITIHLYYCNSLSDVPVSGISLSSLIHSPYIWQTDIPKVQSSALPYLRSSNGSLLPLGLASGGLGSNGDHDLTCEDCVDHQLKDEKMSRISLSQQKAIMRLVSNISISTHPLILSHSVPFLLLPLSEEN